MKVTLEKFNEYVVQFVSGVMIPDAKKDSTKFLLGLALGTGHLGLTEDMVKGLEALGVADEAGIDVDKLKTAVYKGLEVSGGYTVPFVKVTLEKSDADKFFKLVETGAVS